jgi:plasmid stabilization system protein ParE
MVVREIIWTKRANKNFNTIIDYLEITFGENVTKAVVQRTYKNIEIIAKFPNMGTVEDADKGIRGFVISKHNTIFYRTTKQKMIILNLFSNRMNLKRKKY